MYYYILVAVVNRCFRYHCSSLLHELIASAYHMPVHGAILSYTLQLCCAVYSEKLATSSRRRLAQEHLEERYRPEMDIDFGALMGGFKEV